MHLRLSDQKSSRRTTQNVDIVGKISDNLLGIS